MKEKKKKNEVICKLSRQDKLENRKNTSKKEIGKKKQKNIYFLISLTSFHPSGKQMSFLNFAWQWLSLA